VEIRRTAYGVPHIKGQTLEAVAFGFAYAQAEDHLLNIMERILTARGELALHFGPGEDGRHVQSDFWSRQFRVAERADETYDQLAPDFRSMLAGFASGLNYYVELHRDELPGWIPEVSGRDIAAHGLAGVMRFAFDRRDLIERFLAQRRERITGVAPPAESTDLAGSNMWALAPERTASGSAILMGNPHQPWSPVATYYEAHLTVPGVLDFYGSTFVGRPVLTTGFNAHLSWSHTVNYPDLEEIYELRRDPDDRGRYLLDGASHPIVSEEASVLVKNGSATSSERRTFLYTPFGPVIDEDEEHIWVLKSAAWPQFRSYEQWLRMMQAQSLEQFERALELQAIPMFNIVYADRDGNILYLWNGTVPDLPHAAHDAEAVPVSSSAAIWSRIHQLAELPRLQNPAGGYLQNSNDPPYFTNLHQPLRIEDYPAHFPRHRLGLRTQHGLSLLHHDRRMTLEESRDSKFSPRMLLAERVKEDLLAAIRSGSANAEVLAAAELLAAWDNTASPSSRGSVLFERWWRRYAYDGRDLRARVFAVEWTPDHPDSTPRGLGDTERALAAFSAALAETKERWGSYDVSWGEVHRVRVGKVDLPVGGCGGELGCFRVLSFRDAEDGKRVVDGGDSWIFTVEMGPTPRAYSVVGYSQSEVPGSPHESDQTELFANGQMKAVAFTEEEIEAQLLRRYRPGAATGP
jgi:acyl-homoserine-lactone acylase